MIFPLSPKNRYKKYTHGFTGKKHRPTDAPIICCTKAYKPHRTPFPPEQAHPPPSRWTRRNTGKGNSVHFDTYMGSLNQPRWLNITPRSHFCQRDLSSCHNFCTSYLFFVLFFGIFARYKTTFSCFFGLQM